MIETDRLILREYTIDDFESLYDSRVKRYVLT